MRIFERGPVAARRAAGRRDGRPGRLRRVAPAPSCVRGAGARAQVRAARVRHGAASFDETAAAAAVDRLSNEPQRRRRAERRERRARGGDAELELRAATARARSRLQNIPLRERHRQGAAAAAFRRSTRCGVAGRDGARRRGRATSSPRRSCRRACTRSRWPCSTRTGNGELYLRDLELERNDWFYVGMADLTLIENDTSGPIEAARRRQRAVRLRLLGRRPVRVLRRRQVRRALAADGERRHARRAARRICSATSWTSRRTSLFRRIDPDYYYPTFGDDGTVEEMAPTLGKFYVKLAATARTTALWGNFKIGYMDNELAQVDRGLYGANLHYESRGDDELRRAALRARRLRRRARHAWRAARSSAAPAARCTSCGTRTS